MTLLALPTRLIPRFDCSKISRRKHLTGITPALLTLPALMTIICHDLKSMRLAMNTLHRQPCHTQIRLTSFTLPPPHSAKTIRLRPSTLPNHITTQPKFKNMPPKNGRQHWVNAIWVDISAQLRRLSVIEPNLYDGLQLKREGEMANWPLPELVSTRIGM